jgi:hypothetical protein
MGSSTFVAAQVDGVELQEKTLLVKDTLQIDSLSINPVGFKVKKLSGEKVSENEYEPRLSRGFIVLNPLLRESADSLIIRYKRYPEFMTKSYSQFDPNQIVSGKSNLNRIYKLGQQRKEKNYVPFKGLNTSGSISRGITAGTNQNAVLDSELDLQISGQITDNVNLRASIQDNNVPIQESGYSQNLNQFDQVFIELYGENWKIRAGDVNLVEDESYFANYQKKVQGLSVAGTFPGEETSVDAFAAGALVRGVFTRNRFRGQEGNQGPYKLTGPNGELFALIVSGSETVFVNGVAVQRGESEDYTIDYNAGEITFNPTFPITSEMRIIVQFQYADRNYSRIVATGGGKVSNENFEIGAFVYSENDLKNQPLQQNLSDEQKQILADAGDDQNQMVAPSAVESDFDENRVLYRKETVNGLERFVYSTNPDDDLFQVKFTLVGANQGNYVLSNATAIAKVYEYVAPQNSIPQGNYSPVTRLFAPEKLQLAVVNGSVNPTKKTDINFELAASKNDQNLYSDRDAGDNDGFAGHVDFDQLLATFEDKSQLDALGSLDYVNRDFKTIQRIYAIEFNRNWNLSQTRPSGNQRFAKAGLRYSSPDHGTARIDFQNLDFSESYSGFREQVNANLKFGRLKTHLNGSFLKSEGQLYDSKFFRGYANAQYDFDTLWVGTNLSAESNKQFATETDKLTGLSQRFNNYEIYTGIGDSTGVYAQIGYRHRVNDSLRESELQRVSASDNYYLKSRLIQNKNTRLSVYANFRDYRNTEPNTPDEQSLNSRVLYNQFLFERMVSLNTAYETNSGTLPRQEFTYVEVNPGEGEYTWNDYNDNGVQELEEFEVSPYPDQAKYLRVLLPNQVFIKTHQNKFSQIITLNGQNWKDEEGFKKVLSHFYNQTSYLINRKVERQGNTFEFNPFKQRGENELAVNLNFRNTIFFNRGKQHYTTSYSYISTETKNLLTTGLQENNITSHKLDFTHKFEESWLANFNNQQSETENKAENFDGRNYTISSFETNPKLSYLYSPSTRFSIFYQYENQDNQLGEELLQQQKLGTSFTFNNGQDYSINGEFNYIYNDFTGNEFSPVAYQMLQGLQPNKNFTWSVLAQKKLTGFLDLNLSYFGRKSENSKTIHTGSVQLRAYF